MTEDPARDGANWFVYCGNDPVNRVDADGRVHWLDGWIGMIGQFSYATSMALVMAAWGLEAQNNHAGAALTISAAATFAALAVAATDADTPVKYILAIYRAFTSEAILTGLVATITGGIAAGSKVKNGIAQAIIASNAAYSVILLGALFWTLEY